MQNIVEFVVWHGEATHIAFQQLDARLNSQMRHAESEGFRIPAENSRPHMQIAKAIAVRKTFQQPCAKKPRSSSHKNVLSPRLFPESFGVPENMCQIFSR